MKLSTVFLVLGMASVVVISACGGKEESSARCDHAKPKTFVVKVVAGKDGSKPPKVDKKTVVACFEDDIVFEGDIDNFTISFAEGSPFGADLRSTRGKAKGRVKVDPKDKEKSYKYDVVVPGRPVLDPRIIIRTR